MAEVVKGAGPTGRTRRRRPCGLDPVAWGRRAKALRTTALGALVVLTACGGSPTGPGPADPTAGRDRQVWRELVVADEDRCSPYDAGDYRYPASVEDDVVAGLGGIFSPYTCEAFASTRETDVDHVIARSEAHDSGLCRAGAATRERFAADLRNLTLAAPALNRHEKSGKDAADWVPDRNRCWFAQTVVDVRRSYDLTIDELEMHALERILAGCTSSAVSCDVAFGS